MSEVKNRSLNVLPLILAVSLLALSGCGGAAPEQAAAPEETVEEQAPGQDVPEQPGEPAPPEEASEPGAFVLFEDGLDDVFICDQGEAAVFDDLAADIRSIHVEQLDDGVRVRVSVRDSAADSSGDHKISIQARIGQSGGYQVGIYEYNEGAPKIGRLETPTDVEAGTEGDVSASAEEVTFFFPGTTIQAGDTATARTFHTLAEGDDETCDLTKAFDLAELVTN